MNTYLYPTFSGYVIVGQAIKDSTCPGRYNKGDTLFYCGLEGFYRWMSEAEAMREGAFYRNSIFNCALEKFLSYKNGPHYSQDSSYVGNFQVVLLEPDQKMVRNNALEAEAWARLYQ